MAFLLAVVFFCAFSLPASPDAAGYGRWGWKQDPPPPPPPERYPQHVPGKPGRHPKKRPSPVPYPFFGIGSFGIGSFRNWNPGPDIMPGSPHPPAGWAPFGSDGYR